MNKWLRRCRYALAWENYQLLFRAASALYLTRAYLKDHRPSPLLSAAIQAVDPIYLRAQKGWKISDPERIVRLAAFLVRLPFIRGKCVQQSLVSYRLLNGYGIPARICFGIKADNLQEAGHAWVVLPGPPDRALGERFAPQTRFKMVYQSPRP